MTRYRPLNGQVNNQVNNRKIVKNPHKSSMWQRYWQLGLLMLVCLYFAFHTLFGARGYYQLKKLEVQQLELSHQYNTLKKDEAALKTKVDMMRPEHLDADLAEELARKNLGFTKPDEVVVDLAPESFESKE
jgi:cell division protein FtsB